MSINWYPGHMHKATREIREILPTIDVIIEIVDARIPYSSENPVIQKFRNGKPCIKLLNKSDLADPATTRQWVEHLEQQHGVKAMAISKQETDRIRSILDLSRKLAAHKPDDPNPVRVMITGIPNVGKSTLINILAGRVIAKTGNEPAITKGQQMINLDNGIMLIDTPGILWPKVENEKSGYRLAATGAIKETALSYEEVALFTAEYLLQAYPGLLQSRYKLDAVPATDNAFLETIGRQRGCLMAGNRVNLDKISRIFINELRDFTLGPITLETPAMAETEKAATIILMEQLAAEKKAKKEERKKKAKDRS